MNRLNETAAKKLLFLCLFLAVIIVIQSVLLVQKEMSGGSTDHAAEAKGLEPGTDMEASETLEEPDDGTSRAELSIEAFQDSQKGAYDCVMQFLTRYYGSYGNSIRQRAACEGLLTEEAAESLFPEALFKTNLAEKDFRITLSDERICVTVNSDKAIAAGYFRCEIAGEEFTSDSWYLLDVDLIFINGSWIINQISRMEPVILTK